MALNPLFPVMIWGSFHYRNETDLPISKLRKAIYVLEERLEDNR